MLKKINFTIISFLLLFTSLSLDLQRLASSNKEEQSDTDADAELWNVSTVPALTTEELTTEAVGQIFTNIMTPGADESISFRNLVHRQLDILELVEISPAEGEIWTEITKEDFEHRVRLGEFSKVHNPELPALDPLITGREPGLRTEIYVITWIYGNETIGPGQRMAAASIAVKTNKVVSVLLGLLCDGPDELRESAEQLRILGPLTLRPPSG